ncbi:MAG: DUF2029 domain-containing protein [Candidatus Methanomethylophilaceae archaeon]|nr:DUF2029 domain-containing protein [Candidatus Methanomethylophilaceae archaeon]
MLEDMDRVKKMEIFYTVLLAIAFIGYLIAIYVLDIETEVIRDRFPDADQLFNGDIPITEYPPLSLIFFVIPRIFFSDPFGYNIGYVIMIFVITIVGLHLMRRTAESLNMNPVWAMTIYSVLIALLLEYVADRYDIIPAVMTLASFYFFINKKMPAAFIILALAMMTKLYPAILLPIYLIIYMVERDWKGFATGTVWFLIGAAVVALPCLLIEPDLIMGFMGYHSVRPLEIDSFAATLIYPFSLFGLTDVWIQASTDAGSYGSDNLRGPLCDAVAPWLTPIMMVLIVLFILWYGNVRYRLEKVDERAFVLSAAIFISLMIFILVGKVLSSQYIIWVVPFLALSLLLMKDHKLKWRIFWLSVVTVVLTQINFAYTYLVTGGGESISSLSIIMILVRNLMLLAITLLLLKEIRNVRNHGSSDEDRCFDLPFKC